ncbi:hypothetical protein IEO21_08612 [Rhodonia placenta]|uniref:Enoyl reductase (ER) domain-containing protein n=1 Tax=Rhodonia placenta TaxID=104341 RepID=A0A8H7NW40_9APHY|nr:hypothetical protein IEO21_08612 [Postia placenta]
MCTRMLSYFVANDASAFTVLENKENLPWSTYVGVCGMPGQTAHHAWREFAHPQKGDVAFVTTGAGPVGATVIQLAKKDGLKVIASAGSDEKVEFMKSLGADVVFNYKTEKTADVLHYWDNVGGETLEAAIDAAAPRARFIECGMISAYNGQAPYHVKNLVLIHLAEFYRDVPAAVARGEIKYLEDRKLGLEHAGEAIVDVQTGRNKGKSVIVVAQE